MQTNDPFPKRQLKAAYRDLLRAIPRNDTGDALYSLIQFVRCFGRLPGGKDLLNDYLFRLKTGAEAKNPLRAFVSDKEFVKLYVAAKVGDQYNVPTIAVLRSLEEARAYDFPERCCIKPTHMSGAVILRKEGEAVDMGRIESWFGTNYYHQDREKNYRFLTPKLIVEPLIFDSPDNEDLKFFCHKGRAKFVQVDIGRNRHHTRLYFDRNWQKLDFSILKPMSTEPYDRPENFDTLLSLADALSADFSFIRADFYTDGKAIQVGELTNCPGNGNEPFIPADAEKWVSELLFKD